MYDSPEACKSFSRNEAGDSTGRHYIKMLRCPIHMRLSTCIDQLSASILQKWKPFHPAGLKTKKRQTALTLYVKY